jgi:plasmid stabilization system protein ParE
MAAKPLEIHPAAVEEFKSAVNWYLGTKLLPANLSTKSDRATELVMGSAERWPVGEHSTRKFVLQRFPYAIIYKEKISRIQILAIAHGHRRPGYWKTRL